MGISHSMNGQQVDKVLTQFESTTKAIRGIEDKVARVDGYIIRAKHQNEVMTQHIEKATGIMDGLNRQMNIKSDITMDYVTQTLDIFADIVEAFELHIQRMWIFDMPKQLQKEFGPLLVPAVVLVLIVTVSNCVFGFMLANDIDLQGAFTFVDASPDTATGEDPLVLPEDDEQTFNLLQLFAIFHVCLIGVAVFYIAGEICRNAYRRWKRVKGKVLELFVEPGAPDAQGAAADGHHPRRSDERSDDGSRGTNSVGSSGGKSFDVIPAESIAGDSMPSGRVRSEAQEHGGQRSAADASAGRGGASSVTSPASIAAVAQRRQRRHSESGSSEPSESAKDSLSPKLSQLSPMREALRFKSSEDRRAAEALAASRARRVEKPAPRPISNMLRRAKEGTEVVRRGHFVPNLNLNRAVAALRKQQADSEQQQDPGSQQSV